MLRFAKPPDAVFQAILRTSLDVAIDEIGELLGAHDNQDILAKEDFRIHFPIMAKVFAPSLARDTLRQMRDRLDEPAIYSLTDYHYLLLYDVLESFCTIHNDIVESSRSEEDRLDASFVDPYFIERIDFDALIELYFFDIDFLTPPEVMLALPPDLKQSFNPEIFGISQELPPHREELELKVDELEDPEKYQVQASRYFGPHSKVYPDDRVNGFDSK